jgi:hypothetical protein
MDGSYWEKLKQSAALFYVAFMLLCGNKVVLSVDCADAKIVNNINND